MLFPVTTKTCICVARLLPQRRFAVSSSVILGGYCAIISALLVIARHARPGHLISRPADAPDETARQYPNGSARARAAETALSTSGQKHSISPAAPARPPLPSLP